MSDGGGGATILDVTGGPRGVAASYESARALATTYEDAAARMLDQAATAGQAMRNDELLESGLLSPGTCAAAEAAVLAVTAGSEGLLPASLGWGADALAIRGVVALLEETDRAVHDSFEVIDYAVDRTAVTALMASPLLTVTVLGVVTSDGEDAVTGHPDVVQHAVNGGGGVVDGIAAVLGLPLLTPTTEAAAAELAALYGGDGRPVVRPYDGEVAGGTTQPTSLEDLIEHLGHVAGLSPDPDSPGNGTIEVQTITGPDGEVRHIVYLPGTDDLTTLPWTQDGDVRDMGTNLQLVAGQLDTYQEGILAALHDAGVSPGDPVLVVGHSQGGMEAVAILSGHSGVDVTDVVTAGSPTAQVDGFPEGSHVLSLEQQGDVVPLLDGEANPDSVEQTTVLFDAQPGGGIEDHHDYGTYAEGAAAVDASPDPSIAASVQSLHDHGFLGGPDAGPAHVTSQVFQIVRQP